MQQLFKTLSSHTRLKIIERLLEENGFICECKLVENIDKDRSVIYRHLRKLENVGIIETKKKGKMIKSKIKDRTNIEKLLKIGKVIDVED